MMTDDDRISELMVRWEEARQQGVFLSPEELCADCPQLTAALSKRIRSVVTMERVLGVDPFDRDRTVDTNSVNHGPQPHQDRLPKIPGYEVLNILNEGGMGVVYKARQKALERIVAVKMIASVRSSPRLIARFYKEAEATARLQHPNIIQIFEIGHIRDQPFYSMELVEV